MGMKIKLNFFGAAQNVTGSCYLAEANGVRILVDCGLYQERDLKQRNWDPFPVPPSTIDAVLLTHAHLDHCGRLPKLVKDGFRGKIFCTPATADIAQIIMKDSAFLQEEDIKHKKARHEKHGKTSPFPYEPLYTQADVAKTVPLLTPVGYKTPVPVAAGMTASFREAGHIFGSTSIKLTIGQGVESRSILFSGDVGRWDMPIINDPAQFDDADYVLVESTYGDRLHSEVQEIPSELARIINETAKAGGNIVIPSFAVERTQELLYHLNGLLRENRIPHLLTFVDSPMAIKVTEIFKKHPELFDEETRELLQQGRHLCDLPGLTMSNTVDQSKAINHIKGTAIIIAGSGMCTGGRIKHHLKNNISRPESTILFVGYQAIGTLGRLILDGVNPIRIFGEEQGVKAQIEKIDGFSAHADQNELLRWITALKKAPRRVFITHGEPDAANAFKKFLTGKTGWNCTVPEYQQEVVLD
jgi:metallo-beta-lactamase family protein